MVFNLIYITRKPQQVIYCACEQISRRTAGLLKLYHSNKILRSKHLIHHCSHTVQVLVGDLHKDAARIGEQLAGDNKAVTQVGQVAVDAESPGVTVCLDHFQLAGQVALLIFHIALADLRLEVRGELDPVGRVKVDHLHPTGQILATSEGCHDL